MTMTSWPGWRENAVSSSHDRAKSSARWNVSCWERFLLVDHTQHHHHHHQFVIITSSLMDTLHAPCTWRWVPPQTLTHSLTHSLTYSIYSLSDDTADWHSAGKHHFLSFHFAVKCCKWSVAFLCYYRRQIASLAWVMYSTKLFCFSVFLCNVCLQTIIHNVMVGFAWNFEICE